MKVRPNLVPIRKIVEDVASWNPAVDAPDEQITYIDIGSIDQASKIILAKPPIAASEAPSRARQLVRQNDVLVSTVRPNLNAVAITPAELDGSTASTGFCVLRANAQLLESRYLFHWVQSPIFVKEMTRLATGQNYPAISDKIVMNSLVPLPNLQEQKRIAAILDTIDALRVKRRAGKSKLQELEKAIFHQTFSQETTPTQTIGALLDAGLLLLHKDGNHGSQYPRTEEFASEGIPFLSAQCIDDNGEITASGIPLLSERKARQLRIGWIAAGDVLLAHNASVGKVALYRGEFAEALIGTSLTAFRPNPDHLTSEYLAAALRSSAFQSALTKNMGQTTRNQVPITAQRELSIPIPEIGRQRAFSKTLSDMRQLFGKLSEHSRLLDALFFSLQHRAFRDAL